MNINIPEITDEMVESKAREWLGTLSRPTYADERRIARVHLEETTRLKLVIKDCLFALQECAVAISAEEFPHTYSELKAAECKAMAEII